MNKSEVFVIGLMSGTSLDGIDLVYVKFDKNNYKNFKIINAETLSYTDKWKGKLQKGIHFSKDDLVKLNIDYGLLLGKKINNFIDKFQIKNIDFIASHGHTILHQPQKGITLQIGDGQTIANITKQKVVCDFRTQDVKLGGQGAPLVPAFHHAVFASDNVSRVIVNIGGISNITYLPKGDSINILGFDTGPGNTLLDAWCKLHTGKNFDEKGQWAAQRSADPELLALLNEHEYFSLPAPKSTGREQFNLPWLQHNLTQLNRQIDPQVVQATLVMLTTNTIAKQISQFKDVEQVFICGGGAYNDFLVEQLESELHECELCLSDELGVSADAVEAMAFAWLAYAHLNNINGSIANVTGAERGAVLGTFCPAN